MEEASASCVVIEGLFAYTALPYVVFLVSYWGLSAFFLLLDRVLLHASTPPTHPSPSPTAAGEVTPLDRFKVQKGLTEERLRFTWSHALHVLGLHLFISIPVGLALSPLWPAEGYVLCLPPSVANALHALGAPYETHSSAQLYPPLTLFRFAYEFLFILILFEFFFFYSHFALHQPTLYKRIHKLHHYYTAPVGPAAQYVHWIEHIVGNSLSPILPAIIVRAHPITYTVWAFLATCTVVASHSGYGRYALITSEEHDMHHKHFNVNFGTLGFLDQLHGTTYAQSPHYLRDQEKKLTRSATTKNR